MNLIFRIRYIMRKDPVVFTFSFKFVAFASSAGGLRNCISRLFWFGTGLPVFKKCEAYFLKEAKAAALQELRPDCHREGGKSNEFKRESKCHRVFALNVPNPIGFY